MGDGVTQGQPWQPNPLLKEGNFVGGGDAASRPKGAANITNETGGGAGVTRGPAPGTSSASGGPSIDGELQGRLANPKRMEKGLAYAVRPPLCRHQ